MIVDSKGLIARWALPLAAINPPLDALVAECVEALEYNSILYADKLVSIVIRIYKHEDW